jgi:hypothetical protein
LDDAGLGSDPETQTKRTMDDLTPQERQLIMTLRHSGDFTIVVHRNERWRVVLAEVNADRTKTGEGADFGSAWDDLSNRQPHSIIG